MTAVGTVVPPKSRMVMIWITTPLMHLWSLSTSICVMPCTSAILPVVAKAVLVSAVPPLMVKTAKNPGGTPIEVFDGFRSALAANRAQFYLDVPSGPFYGYNRRGADASQGVIQNWWRQGMIGSAKAHYEGIKAFSETDQTGDLKAISVPTLVLHGEDDQVVPIDNAGRLSVKLVQNGTLKTYPGYPHGMLSIHADVLNPDLLTFVRG
jgi:non-heme chloroperoxidase